MKIATCKYFKTVLSVLLVALTCSCSVTPTTVWQKFPCNANEDGWAESVDLLAYAFGDKDRMPRDDAQARRTLAYSKGEGLTPVESINGPMPNGKFPYVRWRVHS